MLRIPNGQLRIGLLMEEALGRWLAKENERAIPHSI